MAYTLSNNTYHRENKLYHVCLIIEIIIFEYFLCSFILSIISWASYESIFVTIMNLYFLMNLVDNFKEFAILNKYKKTINSFYIVRA